MLRKRVRELRKRMKKSGVGYSIFLSVEPIDDPNIFYFTGFRQERFHSFSCLLVGHEETFLILSSLDYARSTGKEADHVMEKNGSLVSMLKKIIDQRKTIGAIETILPHKLSKHFRNIKDISGHVYEMRSMKDENEIRHIKKACNIANEGIRFIRENLKKGMKEKDLATGLENEMINLGAEGISFPTIVTSGSRSSHIHPFPSFSEKRIGRGLGLVDFGAIFGGYCSDVTIPFSVGKLTKNEKKIKEVVLKAYEKSIEKISKGIAAEKLYEEASKVISSGGFVLKHGLGHGIGLEVHDYPSISPGTKTKIKKGMTFTIEPGVYVKGTGGSRIENDFLMKANGVKPLTKSEFLKI